MQTQQPKNCLKCINALQSADGHNYATYPN